MAVETGQYTYLESPHLGQVLEALSARTVSFHHRGAGVVITGIPAEEAARVAVETGGLSHLAPVTRTLEETYFDVLHTTELAGGHQR